MAADSVDSVPEMVTRRIGDSEQGESEDPKGKNNKTEKEKEKGQEKRCKVGGVRQQKQRSGQKKDRAAAILAQVWLQFRL